MDTNLVMYDIDVFLNKYTRFMTKDVYISMIMYDNFLNSYSYLYKILESDAILYRENSKYKKVLKIREEKEKLLKLHNQKYLKRKLKKYSKFFDDIKIDGILDNNQRNIILSDENKMLVINNKGTDYLIVGKVKYLVDVLNIKQKRILVLVGNDTKLKKLLKNNDLELIDFVSLDDYSTKVLKDKKVVNNRDKYDILINYLMNDLFRDKGKFNVLYKAFSNNIYLNKDYIKYDNFKDYHNYIYKRMFLSSKLSLTRFVDKEIIKRKKYLRTIKNELVSNLEEVEIANYLCFRGVSYEYVTLDNLFFIRNRDNLYKLKVGGVDDDFDLDKKDIFISDEEVRNGSYKEQLDEKLEVRHINVRLVEYKYIYDILRDSMIDNYFSEFVSKYLCKYLDYYDINKNFDNTNLNEEQRYILKDVYFYYIDYLKKNNYVTEGELSFLISDSINGVNYKYIIINCDMNLKLKGNVLKIWNDYKGIELIKTSIKLLYDYKKYLYNNKILVSANTFVDEREIFKLTNLFLKDNLGMINDYFVNNDKRVLVYLYDDSNRLYINKNIAKCCYEIVRKADNILIGVNDVSNINSLVYRDFFVKVDKKRLSVNGKKIVECEEILGVRKSYEKIILPFLIEDSYHEDLVDVNNDYMMKLMVCVGLSKCKKEIILICPKSKKSYVNKILKRIKNVYFFE